MAAVIAAVIALAVAVVAAACGTTSSRPKVSAARVGPAPSAGSAPSASSPPVVLALPNPQYGEILTNAAGFALYTYTADEPGGMGCDAQCLAIWPPLLLPAGVTKPLGGTGVNGLGTFARGSHLQVTYRGLPLYTFVKDRSPGQVTGQNLVDPAGKWLLATLNATPTNPPVPANAQPATTQPSITQPSIAHQAGAPAPLGQPPATQPPATQPPATQAPTTHPPATSPPVTNPPVTQPPPTSPPVPTTPPTSPPVPTTPPTTAPGLPSY